MGIGLGADEVVKIAIQVEKSGHAYYTELAGSAAEAGVRELCTKLASDERQHILAFETIRQGLPAREGREQYPGEFKDYVTALIDARIFSDEDAAIKKVKDSADAGEAIDNAIGFEKDTILLMTEMKGVMPSKDRPTLERMMDEERKHIRLLAALKGKL